MTVEPHTIYAIQKGVSGIIDGITNQSLDTGITQLSLQGDGRLAPEFIAVGGQAPLLTFITQKIAAALDLVGVYTGHLVDGTENIRIYWQQMVKGGSRAGINSHKLWTINDGIIVPQTLTVARNGVATLTYLIVATFDGVNDPIVFASGQSLTGSPVLDEAFTLGPVSINGTLVQNNQSMTIDFGYNIGQLGDDDGEIWNRIAWEQTHTPSISVQTADVGVIDDLGLSGSPQGATDSAVYLRKMLIGGGRVDKATAEHISFSVDQGRAHVQNVSGDVNNAATATVMITPGDDLVNDVLAVNTATAIP